MIELQNVTKIYNSRFGKRTVLDNISLSIKPGEKVGILGRNGSGKSTLLRIIGGSEPPTSGRIIRNMSVSWPITLASGLQPTLSGIDNLKLICRIYNKPIEGKRAFIEEFTQLGKYLHEPIRVYSSGMRAKLALGLSLILDFECYLVDEALAVGDKQFQDKYQEILEKKKRQSLLFVSHFPGQIEKNCETAYVLNNGKLTHFTNVKEAITTYSKLSHESQMELN